MNTVRTRFFYIIDRGLTLRHSNNNNKKIEE